MRLFLLTVLFSGNALASADFPIKLFGDQVGNGGKIIVCRSEQEEIISTKLLDFYESEILYSLASDFTGDSYLEMAANAAARLEAFDSRRANRYRLQVEDFLQNTRFVTSPLIETPDSDHIVAPPFGCNLEQVAIQLKPSFPQDRLFTINRDLWDAMSDADKAGLVLHEVIYNEAIARGHKNSIGVRYINAVVSSDRISSMSETEYYDVIHSAKMWTERIENAESDSIWILLDSVDTNWDKAKRACHELEQSTLPSADQLETAGSFLASTSIGTRIRDREPLESWTSYRRPEDGAIAVGYWLQTSVDIVFRPRHDFANILCIMTKEIP